MQMLPTCPHGTRSSSPCVLMTGRAKIACSSVNQVFGSGEPPQVSLAFLRMDSARTTCAPSPRSKGASATVRTLD
eukprot:1510740-Pyramimonas_sp.AAC.1